MDKYSQVIKEKLKNYSQLDFFFLKKQWRQWIANKEFDKFDEILQRGNIQSVYALLDNSKILYIEPARNGFSRARLTYHKTLDLIVLFKINEAENRIDLLTFYPEEIKHRRNP